MICTFILRLGKASTLPHRAMLPIEHLPWNIIPVNTDHRLSTIIFKSFSSKRHPTSFDSSISTRSTTDRRPLLVFKVIFLPCTYLYSHFLFVVEASATGPFIQYSSNLANSVQANMILTFDTTSATYTNSTG